MSPAGAVLVVEDDEDDLFALQRAMRKAAVEAPVHVATDGRQAIDYLAGTGHFADRSRFPLPKVIFLDLKLPLVNGFGVLDWMRKSTELAGIKVIVLSGSDEPVDHERAKELGARSYLVKPATPAHIAAAFAN